MIKFKYTFDPDFILSLRNNFIRDKMLPNAKALIQKCSLTSPEWVQSLSELLTEDYLVKTVFSNSNDILKIKTKYFEELSIVFERYNPNLYFKYFNLNEEFLTIDLRSVKNKNLILDYKIEMIVELAYFESVKKSSSSKEMLRRLRQATSAMQIKEELKFIKSAINGGNKELKDNKNNLYFPSWIDELHTVFNYKELSKSFGYKIVESSGLKVCPFCNEEKITIVIGESKKSRPDLDHFYPKSKYPFLAVSLRNLIPVGKRCNTPFKSDTDMSEGYMHPLNDGMNDVTLFNFTYNPLSRTVDFCITDYENFILNQILFEIDAVYTTSEFKKIYLDFKYRFNYHKGLGNEEESFLNKEFMARTFNISPESNLFTSPSKKFELDALADIFRDS